MVDNQSIVLLEHGLEMGEHTPWLWLPVHDPGPRTPEPPTWPWTPETHPPSGLVFLALGRSQKPRLAVPTLLIVEAARDTSDVDVDLQLLGESAGGDSLPDIPAPDVPLPVVPLTAVRPDDSVGEKCTSPLSAEEAMVIAFILWLGSWFVCFLCCIQFISGTN